MPARRLTSLTPVGTEQASVSRFATPAVSSMLSSVVTSLPLRRRRSRTSTSKYRRLCRALILLFSIRVTPIRMLLSGKLRQKTSLLASSRTSTNIRRTKQVRLSLLPARNSNQIRQIRRTQKNQASFRVPDFVILLFLR